MDRKKHKISCWKCDPLICIEHHGSSHTRWDSSNTNLSKLDGKYYVTNSHQKTRGLPRKKKLKKPHEFYQYLHGMLIWPCTSKTTTKTYHAIKYNANTWTVLVVSWNIKIEVAKVDFLLLFKCSVKKIHDQDVN